MPLFDASGTPFNDAGTGFDAGAGSAGNATGSLAGLTLTAPAGSATGAGAASGSVAAVTLTAATASATGGASATGLLASLTLTAPAASATGGASAVGSLSALTLTAPTGSASSGSASSRVGIRRFAPLGLGRTLAHDRGRVLTATVGRKLT